MFASAESPNGIVALLGPTNTGKTHRAIERMLEHPTGMIGLPLRLLAREVYDRITARIGERLVALITGEEKRVPRQPKYWICTVEAMPPDLDVDFVAVDEIQLGAHRERGHVFTDRLLNLRGRKETWFLGSETARQLILRLVPTATVRSHPRLSRLHGRPAAGLSMLPKRSAVVAFSSQRVYELAERIRIKHGGAAVVLGALSPRTRNAQVAMYQAGEVDFLVATDAIGMGLNLDIRHIAFADVTKFDGRESRPLELAEMAQIAGRAGRYLDDGSFGVLAPRPAMPLAVVKALEGHRFPHVSQFFWRNSRLDFTSIECLVASLRQLPQRGDLRPIEPATDHLALLALVERPEIRKIAVEPSRISLLWEVCQIPDYPQLLFELHVRLLMDIYLQLNGPTQRLDSRWLEEQLRRIDRIDGDIESIMAHIANIRTWNYVSQRVSWLDSGLCLAERAREIEDRLSDALHAKLVDRFVERRRSYTAPSISPPARRSLGQKQHPFAQLLLTHSTALPIALDPLTEQARFTDSLVDATHDEFELTLDGKLLFERRRVGNLLRGSDLLHPDVQIHLDPDPGRGACTRVRRRLLAYCRDLVEQLLAPMRQPAISELTGAARGLLYQLERGLGTVRTAHCQPQLAELADRDRQLLASHGMRIGRGYVYFRHLLAADALTHRHALAACYFQRSPAITAASLTLPSVASPAPIPSELLTAVGLAAVGPLLLRVDTYERLVAELRNYSKAPQFTAPRDLSSRLGCDVAAIAPMLEALGYVRLPDGRWGIRGRRHPRHPHPTRSSSRAPNHLEQTRHSPTENNSDA